MSSTGRADNRNDCPPSHISESHIPPGFAEGRRIPQEKGDPLFGSFVASLIGHLVVGILCLTNLLGGSNDFVQGEIYSVTLEESQFLGGISQVPKDTKKTEMAPMKKVAAQTQPEEEKKVEEKPVKPEPPAEPEDAEVSLSELKSTPVPPKPTPEVKKATPVPAKPTAKPTAAPTKSPNKQKSDGEVIDKRYQAALQRYLGESTDAGGQNFGGARAGVGKGGGGGKVVPPEVLRYQNLIKARSKAAWNWFGSNDQLLTQVVFELEPNGKIKNVTVYKSSGDRSFDESVVRALLKASPLPPPPAEYYNEWFRSVRIAFDPNE
jgi:TonB family protein